MVKMKKLDDQINVLIESSLKKEAEKILADEGTNISEYVRECLKKKVKKAKKDSLKTQSIYVEK